MKYILLLLAISYWVLTAPPVQAQGFIPIPGQSCSALQGQAKTECQKALCPTDYQCTTGKCLPIKGGNLTESAKAAALPCNFTIEDMVQAGVNMAEFIFGIVGSLALLMFVYGGFTFLISRGNQEMVTKGKNILTGALTGLVITLGAALIVKFVSSLVLPGGAPNVNSSTAPASEIAKQCKCDASFSGFLVTQATCTTVASQYQLPCQWNNNACQCSGIVPVPQDKCSIAGIKQQYNIPDVIGVSVNGSCNWQ